MSKNQIAAALYKMKRTGQELMTVSGELVSVDELLTQFFGREIGEAEGQAFLGTR